MDIILNGRLIGERHDQYLQKYNRDGSYIRYFKDGQVNYYNADAQLHREDGPAVIYTTGYQAWFINGERHREDGPAEIYMDHYGQWYHKWYRDSVPLGKSVLA